MKTKLKIEPEVLYRNGKPSKVLLDFDVYEAILERLEDQEDLAELRRRRSEGQTYISLEDYLDTRLKRVPHPTH